MKELSSAYMSKRKTKNKNGISLNNKFENLLEQSIKDRKNIIFETTGGVYYDNNPIVWLINLLKKYNIGKPYLVTLIYPIVKEENILQRVKLRSESQLKKNPPFYRTIDKDSLIHQINNAKHNFCFYIVPMLLYFGEFNKIIAFKND